MRGEARLGFDLHICVIVVSMFSRCTRSSRFLRDLEVRLGEDLMISQIGDIVLRHCPAFRSLYVPYVTNMMYQEALFERLLLVSTESLEGPCLDSSFVYTAVYGVHLGRRTGSFCWQ